MFIPESVRYVAMCLQCFVQDDTSPVRALITTRTKLCMLVPPQFATWDELEFWATSNGYDITSV